MSEERDRYKSQGQLKEIKIQHRREHLKTKSDSIWKLQHSNFDLTCLWKQLHGTEN